MPDICPRCGKAVYHAESVRGGGKVWHKKCFKCPDCGKRLDSANLAMHGSEAYCKACHGRRFGPKGFGFGQGAGALSMDGGINNKKEPRTFGGSSNGGPPKFNGGGGGGGGGGSKFCGECGVKATGGKFCHECGAPQGSGGGGSSAASSGPPPPPASARPSAASRGFGGGGVKKPFGGGGAPKDACGRCGKTVYHAEKVIGGGQVWHKVCFKCTTCGRKLDSTTLREHEGSIYCASCHGANFGPKGYGFGGGAGALARTQ